MDTTQAKYILLSQEFLSNSESLAILDEYTLPAIRASKFVFGGVTPDEIADGHGVQVETVNRNLRDVAVKMVEARAKVEIVRWD